MITFARYHGLGNDYIVIRPPAGAPPPPPAAIRRLCDRQRGLGGDGIVWGPLPASAGAIGLRIFNPDGSEAELSGNGLRIFARWLWDEGLVDRAPQTLQTAAGPALASLADDGKLITVSMGRLVFDRPDEPVETTTVAGTAVHFVAVHIGNPHCVVLDQAPSPELARRLGPALETHARFPGRTNVQFLRPLDAANIAIEIWERGAGYTLASGSSSCAAAAVAHRLGLCGPEVSVHMPGGRLQVVIQPDWTVVQTGPVSAICKGTIAPEFWELIINN